MGKILEFIANMGGVKERFVLLFHYPLCKFRYKKWSLTSWIKRPIKITPSCIVVDSNVLIYDGARIQGIRKWNDSLYNPRIEIKSGVIIQQGVHITCAELVLIGEKTSIGAWVTITDINHKYKDVNLPIDAQDIEVKSVVIGKNCKIYNGVVILPGVRIGEHVIIGANSVVTTDIPSFSVAVGAPARVVKQFNNKTKKWDFLKAR